MPWPEPDLIAWERALWQGLRRAVVDPRHPWRFCTLATADAQGADARMVVLREVEDDALVFATDARSTKLRQLAASPRAALVFWHPRHRVQLRIVGAASWRPWPEAPGSVADYAASPRSGTPIPTHDAWRAGDEHHGVRLVVAAERVDVLALRREGHARAVRTGGDGPPSWTWVTP